MQLFCKKVLFFETIGGKLRKKNCCIAVEIQRSFLLKSSKGNEKMRKEMGWMQILSRERPKTTQRTLFLSFLKFKNTLSYYYSARILFAKLT
jgi:hypothetical protein